MKRTVSFGLALALLLCMILMPGCAQHPVSPSPEGEEQMVTLAGGAADTSSQQSQPQDPGDPEASADPDQQQGQTSSQETQQTQQQEDPDLTILSQPRTQQYGSCSNYTQSEGGVTIRLNHPSGDIPALDQAVTDWAGQTARDYQASLPQDSSPTLVASYDSYEVNGRVVGVLVTGTLSYSHQVAPQPVLATFNADRTTGALLTLEELLREGGEDTLRQMAAQKAGLDAGRADLLSNWLLTDQGLQLYLDGALAVQFSYLELLGILDLPNPDRVLDPSKPMIALTFDDGPSKNTTHIVELLRFYNSRATFYVVGNRVSSYADTIRYCADQGNEIGIHTWEHAKLTVLSPQEISDQLTRTEQAVEQYAGVSCASVRPTGGACNDTVKQVAGQLGYYLVNWSVDTEDWKTRDADSTYNTIMSEAYDGAIILCHDLYESTATAMDRAIPDLIAQGYQLVTVSELMSYRDGGAVPGTLYNQR